MTDKLTGTEQYLKEKGLDQSCTELGNSERFIRMHGHKLKHLAETGTWLVWDGTRWKSDDAEVHECATRTVKSIYDEARDCENTQGRQELSRWAVRSESKYQIGAMTALAAKDKQVSVSVSQFDTDATKINCLNGVVDLKTGELVTHAPEHLVMKQAPVEFKRNAQCTRFLEFLNEIFLEDRELVDYVQCALGYSLTGLTSEHCFFLLYGLGANGKTTLCETILNIFSDYARPMEFSTLLSTDKSDVRVQEAVGRLRGIRFAVASETESTKKFSESVLKRLTGDDTLIGTMLHKGSFEFTPSHKLWLQVNHLPGVKDATHGFWRRVRVIPFERRFEAGAVDRQLKDKLLTEREGIFAWLVEGAARYLKQGCLPEIPEAVNKATERYKQDNDVLSRFITDCLEQQYGSSLGATRTYEAYKEWCYREEEQASQMRYFTAGMEERGISKHKTSKGFVFQNYRLKDGKATNAGNAKPSFDEWRRKQPKPTESWETYKRSIEGDNLIELDRTLDFSF